LILNLNFYVSKKSVNEARNLHHRTRTEATISPEEVFEKKEEFKVHLEGFNPKEKGQSKHKLQKRCQ